MANFMTFCAFPALCKKCNHVVGVNLLEKNHECPSCNSTDLVPYDDAELRKTKGNRIIVQWGIGVAWKKALTDDPSLVLHQSDKSHPNPTGSYLAACVFYATLFNKSPMGLPGELKKGNHVLVRIAPDEAATLQKVAWQTVQEMTQRRREKAGR